MDDEEKVEQRRGEEIDAEEQGRGVKGEEKNAQASVTDALETTRQSGALDIEKDMERSLERKAEEK